MKISTLTRQLVLGTVLAAFAAVIVEGCGGGGYGGSAYNPPPPQPKPTPSAGSVVHVNFFGNGNGSINTPPFGTVSGFTQQAHAEVMAFSPGEQITITNDDTTTHTLNVFSAYPTPGPQSTATNSNGGILGPGYMSGPLSPGQTTPVLAVTSTPGDLYIICGIHFLDGMQDGIVVNVNASPGPEATPVPSASGSCHGYGC